MRRTLAGILAVLLAPASARAEEKSVHATFSGDVNASDNAFSAPSGNREPDVYFAIRPGILFGYETPRTTQEASGELEALEYARNSDKPSLTFRVILRSAFTTGPKSEVVFTAAGSTGRLNAIGNRGTPDQTIIQITPAGSVGVIQGDVGEAAGYQATQSIRVSQGLTGRWAQSTTDATEGITRSGEAGAAVAMDKSFDGNSIGGDAGVTYSRLLAYQKAVPAINILEVGRLDRQISPHVGLNWRHDINRNWSTLASGGVAWVIPLFDDPYNPSAMKRGTTLSPVAAAQVSYVDAWGFANLNVSRTVAPNLLIAQNTISNGATMTMSVPLRWLEESSGRAPRYIAAATAGYVRTELIDATSAEAQGTFSVVRFDVGVAYSPRPAISYSLRYALSHQNGDSSATAMVIPSITTNTISFTFSMRYPEKLAVQPHKRRSVRADGSDLAPLETPSEEDTGVGGNTGGGGAD